MATKPLPEHVVKAFGVPYTSGVGQQITLLYNNRGLRIAEALGLNQPGTGEATNQTLSLLAVIAPCQPDWTVEDVDTLVDIERSKGRVQDLMKAAAESRCKADPVFKKDYEAMLAKLTAAEAGEKIENPQPPASE